MKVFKFNLYIGKPIINLSVIWFIKYNRHTGKYHISLLMATRTSAIYKKNREVATLNSSNIYDINKCIEKHKCLYYHYTWIEKSVTDVNSVQLLSSLS